jgi:hypothetical protein
MSPLYIIGIGCLSIGAGFIYAAGMKDGENGKRIADDSDVGTMDDVRRFGDRFHSPGHPA